MKQNSSMLHYMLFHAASDRNWFLCLMIHTVGVKVELTGEGCTIFTVALRVFFVEQFKVRSWKANKKTNLMISKHLKIGQEIAKYVWTNPNHKEKRHVHCVQYVLSNPNTILLTSPGLACKVRKLVLTLILTQEPKNAMMPREVRLRKGLRGWGLKKFGSLDTAERCTQRSLTPQCASHLGVRLLQKCWKSRDTLPLSFSLIVVFYFF